MRQRDNARAGHGVRDYERADVLRDAGGIEAASGDRIGHYASHAIQTGYGQGSPGQAGDLDELSSGVHFVAVSSGGMRVGSVPVQLPVLVGQLHRAREAIEP